MKRSLASSSSSDEDQEEVSRAPLSQADVPGAENACTAIAVVACADFLFPRTLEKEAEKLEKWIRQGGSLYSACKPTGGYAFAKEVIDFVSPAWPIGCGAEDGGRLQDLVIGDEPAIVLTIGVFSMAILNGGTELFDSHPNSEHANCAVYIRFPSRVDLLDYLHQRFPSPEMLFSSCAVNKRQPRAPQIFPLQDAAFQLADTLPAGFFYVFARDVSKSGAKNFLVAGLEDFSHYYKSGHDRTHYDMARKNRPITLYLHLKFERYEENKGNEREMLAKMLQLVLDQWNEENPGSTNLDLSCFNTNDSCLKPVDYAEKEEDSEGEPISMSLEGEEEDEEEEGDSEGESISMSLEDEEDQEEEEEEESASDEYIPGDEETIEMISFQVNCHAMWFPDHSSMSEFVLRVKERAKSLGLKFLFVWRQACKGMEKHFFADMSVYSANCCFQLPKWDAFFGAIISPPLVGLFRQSTLVSSLTAPPLLDAPGPIRLLAAAVQEHYKPEQMLGFQFAPTGLVTFSMVKHNCEICHDSHHNVVCDLKKRVSFQKCHADVPFPSSVGDLSMAIEGEMQDGGIFPAESSTARMILGFANAIYENARTAPRIPTPGSSCVRYEAQQYEVSLPDVCSLDQGCQVLQITHSKLVIRCKGKKCASQGKRWDRPSHSVTSSWNLSFLFPSMLKVEAAGDFPLSSLEDFLKEPNFFRALGFEDNLGAPLYFYKERIQRLLDWCALKQRGTGTLVDPMARDVHRKTRVISMILQDETMEIIYRECLLVAPDFRYPIELVPRNPSVLACALWIHLARSHGYKRVGDDFYVPTTDAKGRTFYKAIPMDSILTSVCTFAVTPNLCSSVMWNGRVCDDLRRLLNDRNHFPSLSVSKRYLGFSNAVYDLQENVALTWEEVKADRSVMPFNFLDQILPLEVLKNAKKNCPLVASEAGNLNFVETPLFDGPLHDQEFTNEMIFWLYALLGRMFHYVGKGEDNWEVILFLMGAPSSFKSSIIAILQSFLQPDQVGVIGTQVEQQFPLEGVPGKLMAFMTEGQSCTMERDLFKLVASGDPVRVSGKNKKAINLPNWIIPIIFAGNGFLKVLDMDGSVERRVALFPFLFMLRNGQGATDLAQRIFNEEGARLLIKWNTVYWTFRRNIRERIHTQLPPQVREATRQALMAADSFKSFVLLELVQEEGASISWSDLTSGYLVWCKSKGRKPYSVDPYTVEVQAMFRGLGVEVTGTNVLHMRKRKLGDVPFRNVFEVKNVRRGTQEEEEVQEEEEEEEEEEEKEEE